MGGTRTRMRALVLLFLLAIVEAEAGTSWAKVVSCTGCSLARMPKLREALYGDLNNYSNLRIIWKRGEDTRVTLYDEADQEIKKITISKDIEQEDFVKLLADNGVHLLSRAEPLAELSDTPTSRFEFEDMEYLLFKEPVLRIRAVAKAQGLGGSLLTLEKKRAARKNEGVARKSGGVGPHRRLPR